MSKVIIVARRHPELGLMLIRGEFTQKKKVWEAIEAEIGKERLAQFRLFNDLDQSSIEANYSRLCKRISDNGRTILLDESGKPEFLLVEAVQNEWRGWDLNEAGEPVPNPAGKSGADPVVEGGSNEPQE